MQTQMSRLLFVLTLQCCIYTISSFQTRIPHFHANFKLVESNLLRRMYEKDPATPPLSIPVDETGTTRRDFLSSTSAVALAMTFLQNTESNQALAMEESNSVEKSNQIDSDDLPFSSVRKQNTVTLSNGLPVILVNDKLSSRSSVALMFNGPGQFSDPQDIPGLAHLMEHMISSCNVSDDRSVNQDFEDWMEDVDGASNAFTGYEQVRIRTDICNYTLIHIHSNTIVILH